MTSRTFEQKAHGVLRAFPPPRYLTMPAVGIDISDYSLKYVFLEHKHGHITLTDFGKLDLPVGTIESGEIKDPSALVKILSKLRRDHDYEFAHLALPEEHAYLFQTELPHGTQDELQQMLEFHLKENVPIGAEEAVFDFSVYKETTQQLSVNVSVYPAPIVERYLSIFEEAKLVPLSLEVVGQATARALLPPDEAGTVIIVDIGRSEASLSISSGGSVTFTASLETGGDHFTRAITRHLDISFQEAEHLKREEGFRDTKQNRLVYEALLPAVHNLQSAINKHFLFWQMHTDSGTPGTSQIDKVILAGGNANVRGIAEYLEASLEVPIEIGDVWHNVFSYDDFIPPVRAPQSLEYATAVGLALRSISRSA